MLKEKKITDYTPKDLAGWHICLDVIHALIEGKTIDFCTVVWKKWYEKYLQVLEKIPQD